MRWPQVQGRLTWQTDQDNDLIRWITQYCWSVGTVGIFNVCLGEISSVERGMCRKEGGGGGGGGVTGTFCVEMATHKNNWCAGQWEDLSMCVWLLVEEERGVKGVTMVTIAPKVNHNDQLKVCSWASGHEPKTRMENWVWQGCVMMRHGDHCTVWENSYLLLALISVVC